MTALVWLFFFVTCFFAAYVSYRVTRWKYTRKFRHAIKTINKANGTEYSLDSKSVLLRSVS